MKGKHLLRVWESVEWKATNQITWHKFNAFYTVSN